MKVALTVWENRISPVFDSTRMLLIVNIENRGVAEKQYVPFDCDSPFSRAAKLDDLGAGVLICGAISNSFANLIEVRNIRIIPFIAGAVDEVIEAYLMGTPISKKFRMPGYGTRQDEDLSEED
ncbi:MAG: NifB/NifX family molybdenum-iron cluster-binding protein [Deltaproteobacteria bacterium]|nr:NifB/NifX family molybdenum-iron cluster-binding protein [Deltaproteobacteria bacterium]